MKMLNGLENKATEKQQKIFNALQARCTSDEMMKNVQKITMKKDGSTLYISRFYNHLEVRGGKDFGNNYRDFESWQQFVEYLENY